ncbi:hypothetical protein HRbin36_02543 [bacterium HR36]|nr:hypothetical protein HRbin36_02543 [bacterium HR36]
MGLLPPLALWMPPELADCWREPFARAWFEQMEFLAHPIRPEGRSQWLRTIQNGGVLINYPGGKVLVEIVKLHLQITEDSSIMSGNPESEYARWWIETLGPAPYSPPVGWNVCISNPDRGPSSSNSSTWDPAGSAIVDDVCRIFVASGCLPYSSDSEVVRRTGRSIYLCSNALCNNWDSEILARRTYVEEKQLLHPRPNASVRTSSIIYSRGVIRRGLARLSVYTGPAIDPQTRAERYYIALGYSSTPLLRIVHQRMHAEVGCKLATLGCRQILIPKLNGQPWQYYHATPRTA